MPLDTSGLRRWRSALAPAIDAGAKTAAEYVADLAQQLAPEHTGALKASKRVEGSNGRYVVSFGAGLPDARARFQEYGTAHMPAQPYLTPAARAIDVAAAIRDAIRAALG